MSEADCLAYCKEHGFDWNGLYDHFDRVSCWCCPLKNLKELRQLYEFYPELWQKLKDWDEKTWNDYKKGWPIWKLEYRFEFEKRWLSRGGAAQITSILQTALSRVGRRKRTQNPVQISQFQNRGLAYGR